MSEKDLTENIIYPSILFRLQNDYYAVNCKHVASIMQIPDVESLPEAPKNVIGIFRFREKVIPIICLRSLFGQPTVEQEVEQFVEMLNRRKQDHLNWVKELSHCVQTGELFTLATNPHQCTLGQWYDNYEPENNTIKAQLKKLEEPHRLLHESGHEIEHCKKQYRDEAECAQQQRKILDKVTKDYMPRILNVLEDTKQTFREQKRTLLIVIDNGEDAFAMAVDEVLAVEELTDVAQEQQVEKLKGSVYINEIKKSTKLDRLILMIQDDKLAKLAQNYALEKANAAAL